MKHCQDDARAIQSEFEPKELWVLEINEANAVRFCDDAMRRFEEDPYRPLIININSYGGEIDALFTMIDCLDSIRAMAPPDFKIFTVAVGKACSAGAVLLSYGDIRFAAQQSRVMLHQTISGTYGSQPANEAEFKETTRVNNQLLTILKKSCKLKMSLAQLKEKLSHNLYLSPKQAQEFGIIDIIGYPKLVSKTIYDVRVLNAEPPKKLINDKKRKVNKDAN